MAGSQSLERGLEILEVLDKSSDPLGVREISRRMGLSPTIVQRLINTLAEYGYIKQDPEAKKYTIGYRAFGLGWKLTKEDRLISASLPVLQDLSARLLNSYLGVLKGDKALYLLSLQSDGPVAIRGAPGSFAYLHSTAMGKVLLSELDESEVRKILGCDPLPKVTANTVVDVDELLSQLIDIKRLGTATVRGENIPGITSVAAPVRDFSGQMLASISVAYPDNFFPKGYDSEVVEIVKSSAKAISETLGFEA